MPTSIGELQIEINANATKGNVAIDRLVGKLDRLNGSLGRMNTTNLSSLANGVDRLGRAMQTMNTVKTADFTRLAKNMQQMGNINVVALQNASVAMSRLARGFSNLGGVSSNSYQVAEMAKSLGKLGGVNVQRAITNIPQLANAMRNLMATLSNAPRVSQNVIQMANAMANLASQGAKVGTASRSMQNGLNRTSASADRARKSFGGLASVIGKFYASYFLVIRGLKSLGNSINSTADYAESFNFFTVSMGKIASKWDKDWENYGDENARNYSNSFATTLNKTFKKLSGVSYDPKTGLLSETGLKNLGLNLQEVTQYAAQLSAMMDSVGQNGEVTLATTDAFVKLAGDLSSLYNIDYSQAANKLQSVLMGQSRAGYSLGWDTTMASLQETANKFNVTKPVSEMAQFEKQQLRILTILDQSKVAWGDQANTINTLANQIRMFKNNIKEAGMTLGQLFIPVLTKILPLVNGLFIAFKRLFTSIAQILGVKMEDFGQGYTKTEDSIEGLTDDYEDLTDAAKEYKNQAMSFDEINPLKDTDTDSGKTSGTGAGIDLTDEILDATSEYEKAWQEAYDNMQTKAEKFAEGISKALKPISTIFEDIAKGDWLKLGKDTSDLVSGIFKFFSDAIKKVKWKQIGKSIGLFLAGINWLNILKSALTLTGDITEAMADVWFGSLETAPLETAIATILGAKIAAKTFKISTPLTLSIIGATLSIGFAKGKLDPIFDEYDLKEIKKASEDMFTNWFGKNYISITLSDMFVLTSTAIAKPQEIIDALSLMWDDIVNGDFKLNWFNVMEFPSWNEFVGGLKELWNNVKKNYKFGLMGIMEFPVYTDFVKKLKKIWSDIKNGDFKWKLWGIIEMPSFNQIVNGLKKLWKDVKNGDFRFNLFGLFEFPSWNQMKSGIKQMWSNIKNGDFKFKFFSMFEIPTWADMKSAIKQMWKDIKNGDFKFSFLNMFEFPSVNDLKNQFKGIWNGFADWINKKLKIEIPAVEIAGKNITSKTTISLGSVPKFADGGFAETGQLFVAREAGPELVATMGGRTAIASNDQIVTGIAEGIYPAVYNAVSQAMANSRSDTNVNVTLEGDAKKLFKSVQKQATNYTMQTGKPAFNY